MTPTGCDSACNLGKVATGRLRADDEIVDQTQQRLSLDNLRLVQRYLPGELRVHIHWRSPQGGGNTMEYCTFFEGIQRIERRKERWYGGQPRVQCSDGGIHDVGMYDGVDRRAKHDWVVVFLDDVEFVDLPEPLVPAFVRTDFAESVHRRLTRATYFGPNQGFQIIGMNTDRFVIENRETGMVIGDAGIRQDQPPREEIQGGATVMDGVRRNSADVGVGFHKDVKAQQPVPRFGVIIRKDGVGVGLLPGDDRFCQVSEVLFGPFNLDPTAGRPISHR
jgi:hypothetical protein